MSIQFLADIFSNSPNVIIPLPHLLTMLLLVSLAAVFEYYRMAILTIYFFLTNWVFIHNPGFLSLDLTSIFTFAAFLVFGVLLILAVYHHAFSR